MGQFFLRILAFMLGFKHENPKELESRGREMKQGMLLKKLNNRIDLAELESIWLIGGIEYSEPKANKIKDLHAQGLRYDFKIPTNFDFEGDYIDFYQVATKSKRFYLLAMSDTFTLSKNDGVISFFEIAVPYSTSNLNTKLLYYGAATRNV